MPPVSFRLDPLLERFVPRPVASVLAPPLEMMLSLRSLSKAYARLPPTRSPAEFAAGALSEINVHFEATGAVGDIPRSGGLVVVANHPFGGIEGLYLYSLLSGLRPDVRILGNQLLGRVSELAPVLFPVDILSGRAAASGNSVAMRAAMRHVRAGGVLIVFPAGEVSSLDPGTRTVVDPAWHPSVARLILLSRAPVLPVYFAGSNSPLFHAAGLLHPRLRTALLPREFLNKRNRTIPLRIGRVVPVRQIAAFDGDGPLTEHLRVRVYALAPEPVGSGARPAALHVAMADEAHLIPSAAPLP